MFLTMREYFGPPGFENAGGEHTPPQHYMALLLL